MAFLTGQTWYCKSGAWTAVTAWAASTSISAGALRRQNAAPSVGNERVFAATVAGTTGGSEPTWGITQGAKTTDNTVTWIEITGKPGVNGDTTNSAVWLNVKNTAVSQGLLIYDSVTASLQVCTTAGTAGNGSAPSFSATAGVTTSDNTVTWTSLGLASNFGAYAAPWARLNLGLASGNFAAQNDTVYVSNNHAETQASSINYGAASYTDSINSFFSVICVNDTATPPTAAATGASVSTTGTNSITVGANSNNTYIYGVTFNAGSAANTANITTNVNQTGGADSLIMDNCTFNLNNTSSSSEILINNGNGIDELCQFKNCTYTFGSTSQTITPSTSPAAQFIGGTFAATGSVPSTLFNIGFSYTGGVFSIRDANLSSITGTLVAVGNNPNMGILFENCSLGSGVAITSGSYENLYGSYVKVHNCDSAATNYRYNFSNGAGTVQQETTVVRTGGATNGTTAESWKIATTANPTFNFPFVSEEIAQWNPLTSGSHTATIYLASNTALDNGKFWMELEYMGSSSNPQGSLVSSRMAILATAAALTTDSSTWGGSVTNKYKVSVTFSPLMAGPIKARLYVADPSTTVYVDPVINVV